MRCCLWRDANAPVTTANDKQTPGLQKQISFSLEKKGARPTLKTRDFSRSRARRRSISLSTASSFPDSACSESFGEDADKPPQLLA
jgi:hypothetical protein